MSIEYKEIIRELGEMDMTQPDMAALDQMLVKLSVAFTEIGDMRASKRHAFNKKFRECRRNESTAKSAEIEANASEESLEKEKMDFDWDAVKNVINTIKHIQNQNNELFRKGL